MHTKRLNFVLGSLQEARAMVEAMSPAEKTQLSTDWLALLDAATSADPWIIGFFLVDRESGSTVGQCGFKGPPTPDGMVEIAYAIDPAHQGKGYATEAAEALVTYAFESDLVRVVRAHTLPTPNASTRVLTKCGFGHLGEVVDPEDGLVWRWERHRERVAEDEADG